MPSVSFDPVADRYDDTRGYPDYVAEKIALAIERAAQANAQTSFLDMGIGTGRISLPLASLGHHCSGVDISEKMLAQLEAKLRTNGWREQEQPWGTLPDEESGWEVSVRRYMQSSGQASMRLVRSDMTHLPFRADAFDVVVAVHVFHLVDGWQRAIDEVIRVLRPGGQFLHCWDEHVRSGLQEISEEWYRIVSSLGGNVQRPGAASHHSVTELLQKRGLQVEVLPVLSWENMVTPRQIVENITQRLWSSTWFVPDDLFAISAERLQTWADAFYRDQMDVPRPQGQRFVISRTRV